MSAQIHVQLKEAQKGDNLKAVLIFTVLFASLSSLAAPLMANSADVSIQYKKVASHLFWADDYEFTIFKGKTKAFSFVIGTNDIKAQKAVQYFNDNKARAAIEGRKVVLDIDKISNSLKLKEPDLVMKNLAYMGPKPVEPKKQQAALNKQSPHRQSRSVASVRRR